MTDILTLCDEADKLSEAATPGPWRKTSDILKDAGCISTQAEDLFRSYKSPTIQISHDCDFIARSRTLLPQLSAACREMIEEFDEAKGGMDYAIASAMEERDVALAELEIYKLKHRLANEGWGEAVAENAKLREALQWIAETNACDYEYVRHARAALAETKASE